MFKAIVDCPLIDNGKAPNPVFSHILLLLPAQNICCMKKLLLLPYLLLLTALVSAQGYYIEFKISTGSKEAVSSGTIKSYSQDENSRSEVNMIMPQLPGGGIKITSLALKAEPNTVYLLNEKDKTYSQIDNTGNQDYKDLPQADYEVTVVGKETVNGYNATHVTIKINGVQREEMWTTKDLAGYADFSKIKTKYTGKANLYKALTNKGADGMPVRIKANERGQSIQLDLVKAEKRSNPASLFSLSGYTKGSAFSGIPGAENMQEMMEKIQHMTPQEREEIMKRIKEQYSNQPH